MLHSDKEIVINDKNFSQHVITTVVDGERKAKGLIPRNYSAYPTGYYSMETPYDAVSMPLIMDSAERSARIKDQIEGGYRLSDWCRRGNNGLPIPSRDQNGRGYCWIHSGCSALIAIRARDGMPYADLSAYAGACLIKRYRDEGGWGAQGLDWIMEKGLPTSQFWPQKSVNPANDNAATWADALNYRVTEGWIDIAQAQYDRNLTFDQVITCLLLGIPVIGDFNWWGHSVCLLDVVDGNQQRETVKSDSGKRQTTKQFEDFWGINTLTTGFSVRIWNSWGDSWSDSGMGVLTGSKAIPDGATAPRVAVVS
jgi:hypothetical protein